ncbi:C4-dicarboxylate ABC transporter [Rhizobium sp. AC44/96]|uniref:tripartite tricarboxylate transporter TctB family protein n=1 Tax=unclassified Rhizobium TaxID=2613769 RepID=UPI00080F9BE0|nr:MULTISPECIES: tripartite tricarboxylate transporter TctB family protein [unclassified Rhizobium]MDM9620714.1 tripartite tricarboxylate transporter TctB family protein [Rhizobium sp. S96]OCJ02683.1 C4-dicarboxylate ABC transporter [Rhizobium sp. AC44/96]
MSMGHQPVAEKRRPDWAALIIAICLFAVAAVMLWDASHMRIIAQYDRIGPATAPKVVAFGLIGLGIWTVFEAFRGEFPERERQEIAPVVWVVAGLAAQMLLLKTAGFSIATGLLFAFTARGFGQRKLWYSIPFGIVFSFVVWAIFSQLLKLTLPAGPLERLFF